MMKQSDSNCINVISTGDSVTPKFVPVSYGATSGKTTFTAKAQEDVYIKHGLFSADQNGVVNDIRIGNQSLNCSDSGIDLAAFTTDTKRRPVIGVAVDGNIQIAIDVTLDTNGNFEGAFTCEAIDKAPTLAAQSGALNKFFGLGSVSVPLSGTAQLSATALRDCMLRDLLLAAHADSAGGIIVEDITVKGRSLFSGQAADGVSLAALQTSTFAQYVQVNTMIETNQKVIVSLKNTTAAAVTVGGMLYAE
jgi:hypothetical protein